ncbi:hypothetical protein RJP21_19850 [Paenibacillus sp. VCA1]|uniref:hypothetical protein n=1 Tax=Paenibacillus sp. VCA1 TaxID=3039148 RepID=UPI00287147D9|nr:hypothetical protein [Paenibacillus sp. VCA1]MDR9855873.1 hypothetical protein [Paenibacillus sp. VCA1]
MRNVTKFCGILFSLLLISQYPPAVTEAASGTPGMAVASSLGSIAISSRMKVTLEDVNLWPQAGGNILTYTLSYKNTGSGGVSLLNFFSKVKTPGGSLIMGHPVSADAAKKTIQPEETLRVTYYANLKQIQSLKGITIPLYVWDANAKGYLKLAGTFGVPADGSNETPYGKSLNTILDNMPVTARGESLEVLKYGGKTYAKVGFALTNGGKKVLEDPGYAAYLVSGGGSMFKLALGATTVYKVQPGEKKLISYLCEIPPNIPTDRMKLQFTQKDEALQLEYAKFAFQLPPATVPNLTVGQGTVKKMMIDQNSVEAQLQNAGVSAENGKAIWSIQFRLKNNGNKPVTLPSYNLYVRTSSGKSFPADSKGLSGLALKPMEEKIIPIGAQIPLEIEQSALRLELIESASKEQTGDGNTKDTPQTGNTTGASVGGKINLPIAYFVIPYRPQTDAQKGITYAETNSFGGFNYTLESLRRLPWKDEDILAVKLKLTNTQSGDLELPALKGSLKADLLDLSSTTEIWMDREVSALRPGESAEMNVLAHIPYTQPFKTLKVILYALDKEEKMPFLSLSTPNVITAAEAVKPEKGLALSIAGKSLQLFDSQTSVYEGSHANIVFTEMLLDSGEKRRIEFPRFYAYYETGDGEIYESEAVQPEKPASPGARQQVAFRAKLPNSVNISDLKLVLGSEITGNHLTKPEEEPTGFIETASLKLEPGMIRPKTSLTQLPAYPYTLSVLNLSGSMAEKSETVNIAMSYDLQRDAANETGAYDHKLILRITDPSGQSQEKNVSLGTDLNEGARNAFSASFSSGRYRNLGGGGWKLTLYDEMLGERIELGSQSFYVTEEKSQSE